MAVSAAAGAVGSLAGQIARIKGARVVGIAGGADKCRTLTDEYRFDAAIDYKAGSVARALREHCPDGIDVFFDNVGGDVLEAALRNLARGARIVLCGAVSQYNEGALHGPRNYMNLLVKRARMEGFVVFDFAARYGEAAREMRGLDHERRARGPRAHRRRFGLVPRVVADALPRREHRQVDAEGGVKGRGRRAVWGGAAAPGCPKRESTRPASA